MWVEIFLAFLFINIFFYIYMRGVEIMGLIKKNPMKIFSRVWLAIFIILFALAFHEWIVV